MTLIFLVGLIILITYVLSKSFKNIFRNSNHDLEITVEFKDILTLLNDTNKSVFITGKAGTGKSTLLKYFTNKTNKKFVVLAPTGVAALNIGGQTIHSFFRFPPEIINPNQIHPDNNRIELFNELQMVIIDEVSMVRADLMNGIDIALRKYKNKLNEPFGGIQMVFIGDLYQLPPVVADEQLKHDLKSIYGSEYFFCASVFRTFNYEYKELTKIFRQSELDQKGFINMLNKIRVDQATLEDLNLLNSRHVKNTSIIKSKDYENAITLTTKREIARSENMRKMNLLKGEIFTYIGSISGTFLSLPIEDEKKVENELPAPYRLELKRGAQIMMLKNDSGRRWVNGSIGKVDNLDNDSITVNIEGENYIIEKESWNKVEYIFNSETNEIDSKIIGVFTQYPIQLSYAITIHKSQGKTFNKIKIDIGNGAFAHGQVYVALSRSKTLEGIILQNVIQNNDIIVDPKVDEFCRNRHIPEPTNINTNLEELTNLNRNSIHVAIRNNNRIKIKYRDYNDNLSERVLSNIRFNSEYGDGTTHIKTFCHHVNEERTFRISRILAIEILN